MLNSSQKRNGLIIIGLLVFQSFLDFFSIASFLPLIFLIINPGFVLSNELLKSVYDYFGFQTPASFIIAATLVILGFTIFKGVLSFWMNKAKATYIFTIGTELSSRALSRYLGNSYPGFSDADFSRELNRITNQPIAFANNFILPIANLISEGLIFIFIIGCVVVYDVKIILLLTVILIPVAILYQVIRKNTKAISNSIKEKYPLSMKFAQQIVEGLIEIKLYSKEQFFTKRFTDANKDLSQAFASEHIIQNSITRLTEIIAAIVVCFLVIYTVLLGSNYQETILLLSIYAGASFRILPSINRIFIASFQIRTHDYLVQELGDLIDFKPPAIAEPRATRTFTTQLELKNISFGYPDRHLVLHDTSLTIFKGMKVALTGKSGEGKTTLLLILLGFINNFNGDILLDGKSIRGASMRNVLGYVPQNPYILDGTILENIAFGIPLEQMDRSKALRLLQELDLTELIQHLPNGIDTPIGERGVKLSGGQRQRLAIARALYVDADILLFDEITNQVHEAIERDILIMLDRLAQQKKTIIMVTHKISDKNFFDAVYNLEKGKLQEVPAQA